MKTTDKILLCLGAILVLGALLKPDLSSLPNFNIGGGSSVVELDPVDSETQTKVKSVIDVIKNGPSSRKQDGVRLASLFHDMSTLVAVDGDTSIIKSTNDIRNAVSLVGDMLRMNISSKYEDFEKETTEFVQSMIGTEDIMLDSDTRAEAVKAFQALAWACLQGSK